MSTACVNYILYEIGCSFGSEIQSISKYLLNNDFCTLNQINKHFPDLKPKIKNYLELLIKNNLVFINNNENSIIDYYEFDIDGFLAFKRSERFLNIFKHFYNDISYIICYKLCENSKMTVVELIKRTLEHSKGHSLKAEMIASTVNDLTKIGVLEVSPSYLSENKNSDVSQLTDVGEITEYFSFSPKIGQKRHLNHIDIDRKPYQINRFFINRLFKNDIITEFTRVTHDTNTSAVMSTLLTQQHTLDPQSYSDTFSKSLLFTKLKSTHPSITSQIYDDCLFSLSKDPTFTFIDLINDGNSVLLGFNERKVIAQLTLKQLKESVKVIFGSNGLIVFNFLLKNPYIDEIEFLNSVMLPSDKLSSLIPSMLNRGYISKLEKSRTKQYFDEPLVTLLYIDMENLVRTECETCFQSFYKLAVLRDYEERRQKYLLTKVLKVTAADNNKIMIDGGNNNTDNNIGGVKDEEECDELLVVTDDDRKELADLKKSIARLLLAESSIERSLIIFESYIYNQNQSEIKIIQ